MMRYLLPLVALMSLLLGGEKIFLFYHPQYEFDVLPMIPAFFIFFGCLAYQFGKNPIGNGVAVIMGLKVARILLSLIIIFFYVFFVKINAIAFLVSYLAFFVVYLVFETWMFSQFNKKK